MFKMIRIMLQLLYSCHVFKKNAKIVLFLGSHVLWFLFYDKVLWNLSVFFLFICMNVYITRLLWVCFEKKTNKQTNHIYRDEKNLISFHPEFVKTRKFHWTFQIYYLYSPTLAWHLQLKEVQWIMIIIQNWIV